MSDLLVLCYHAVSKRWPADLAVTSGQLESQLGYLVQRGYRGATFTDALTRPAPSRTVVVTFDDAYRSVLELAFPVLRRLGLPGTVFVPTEFADRESPMCWPGIDHWAQGVHAAELIPLSWQELRRLAEAGWEVGSHTRTHARLTELEDAELEEELTDSREECERRLRRPCTSIAYPFGDVDARVAAAAERAGYLVGAALEGRLGRASLLVWPRFAVSRDDSLGRFRRQVSPVVRRFRSSPVGPASDRAYAALLGFLRGRSRG